MHGRQGIVQDIAFRPDGGEIAGAGLDGSITIWDVAKGESQTILRGHIGPVTAIMYTPDGARLVTSSVDGTVRVWDSNFERDYFKAARTQLKEELWTKSNDPDPTRAAVQFEGFLYALSSLRKHFNVVTGVDMDSSGRRAVTASLDDTVRTWDLEIGTCQHWLEGHSHGIFGLAVSADGLRIASADRAATIKVWDARTAQEVASRTIVSQEPEFERGATATERIFSDLRRPTISPLRFAASDRLLLSADSLDPAIKAWDASTLELRFTLAGHRTRVRNLLAAADGRRLISASDDGVLIVWDLITGRLLVRGGCAAAGNIAGGLGAIGLTGDGCIACAWPDETLRLLDPNTLAGTAILRGHAGRIVSVSASGTLVAATRAIEGGTIVDLWQGSDPAPVLSQRFSSEHVSAVCERGGNRIAIGGPSETLTIRDFGGNATMRRFPMEVSCLAFAGGRVVAGNDIGDVFLLELSR